MEQYSRHHLEAVHAILKQYIAKERLAYQAYTCNARYSKQARDARRASHRVLAILVPRFRMLDKFLHQPTANAYYKAAPQSLASILVQCFIADTRIPSTHEVWEMRLTSEHLRALVALGDAPWQTWLAAWEARHPGIIETVCNSFVVDLKGLRSAHLMLVNLNQAQQHARLKNVLDQVKAVLSKDDYELLLENLRAPA